MAENMGELEEKRTTIRDVFKGRCVLITGATGFVGKVLLEKLMRSCRGIKHIYVLIRPTENSDAQQRLKHLFEEKVFDRIRRECSDMFDRVVPLSGDVSLPDCGVRPSDLEIVFSEVSLVLHCAASVRFDQRFREAVKVNVEGVKNVLDLCHGIEGLEGLVHVSTAYAFCNWEEIHEEVYPENVKYDDLLAVCKWMGDEEIILLFESVRNGRPSAYHFTKAVAENLLHKERRSMPLCIVRPSIVTAAWKEPFPGWVDTYYGPSGLIAACGKGVVKTFHACPDVIADLIPVDVVANTIIVAAWNLLTDKPPVLVVNCTSNKANPITWGDIEKICLPFLFKYPSMELFRYPGGSFKKNAIHHWLSMVILHIIPAYLIEAVSRIVFRRVRTVSLYRRIHNVMGHLEYFTTKQFDFYCPNYLMLMDQMDEEDSKVFTVDIRSLNWTEYLESYVLGVRKYLLKEGEETLPAARRRMNRIYYFTLALKLSAICGGAWILYRHEPNVQRVFSATHQLLASGIAASQTHIGRYLQGY